MKIKIIKKQYQEKNLILFEWKIVKIPKNYNFKTFKYKNYILIIK